MSDTSITLREDAPVAEQWMQIVRALMQRQDFSIDQLERILALRDKELHDRAKHEFTTSLAACQADVTKASGDKQNPLFKSRYASIEAMYDAVFPAVTGYGFAWKVSAIPTPEGYADALWFRGTLSKGIISDSIDWPVHPSALVPEGPKGNRPGMTVMQSSGALATYMRKYLLGLMFNVVTGEDVAVDHDGNRQPPPPPAERPPAWEAPAAPKKPTTRDWIDQVAIRLSTVTELYEFNAILLEPQMLSARERFTGEAHDRLETIINLTANRLNNLPNIIGEEKAGA